MKKNVIVIIVALLFFGNICLCGSAPKIKRVLVVYYSITGNTKQMAEAAAEGARSVKGVTVKLLTVKKAKVSDALQADAIIIGTPVHNANVAPPVLEYINSWPFENSPMRDKIGAAFVSAGGFSAGEELVQVSILHSMLIFGMIVVGGSDWKSAFGGSAIVEEEPFTEVLKNRGVNPYFLKKARELGKRVAEVVLRLKRESE
jgi:NAD(P)H dehydrogenase (quinone)